MFGGDAKVSLKFGGLLRPSPGVFEISTEFYGTPQLLRMMGPNPRKPGWKVVTRICWSTRRDGWGGGVSGGCGVL